MLRKLVKSIPGVAKVHKVYKLTQNYLHPSGYFNDAPSDLAGNPLPWFSYPTISFLEDIIQKQWKVFEYGCGYSTLFWSGKCEKTVSVEHDEHWFDRVKNLNSSLEIHLVKEGADRQRQEVATLISSFEAMNFDLPLTADRDHNKEHGLLNIEFADYAAKLIEYPKGFFDVIVVDGMARSLCLFLAADYISDKGIIILDDSQRWQYNDAQNYLMSNKGFNRLDFNGLGPLENYAWTTSILFKSTDFLRQCKTTRRKGAGDLGW